MLHESCEDRPPKGTSQDSNDSVGLEHFRLLIRSIESGWFPGIISDRFEQNTHMLSLYFNDCLFAAKNRFFRSLHDAKRHHLFSRYLDRCLRLWIADNPRLSAREFHLADARNRKNMLRFSIGESGKMV